MGATSGFVIIAVQVMLAEFAKESTEKTDENTECMRLSFHPP
jgi:hypothetical protein